VSDQQTLLDSMFKSIDKTKPEEEIKEESDIQNIQAETAIEEPQKEAAVKKEQITAQAREQKPLVKEELSKTKQRARREAEDAIHSHIRLQSAEQLLKRVDTGFGQKSRAPFQTIVEGVQNAADAVDKAREAQKKSGHSQDYNAQITVRVEVIDKSRGELADKHRRQRDRHTQRQSGNHHARRRNRDR